MKRRKTWSTARRLLVAVGMVIALMPASGCVMLDMLELVGSYRTCEHAPQGAERSHIRTAESRTSIPLNDERSAEGTVRKG
jgi:hypothetical protein